MGCRLNAFESDVMRNHAVRAGLNDCVIVNTCAVTNEAVSQARQTIRKLRRERPGARLIVTGCAAELQPEKFEGMDEVDLVVSNDAKLKAATFLDFVHNGDNDPSLPATAPFMADAAPSRTRAYVQIQTGCNHRCTFCIIPFARGPSRSVPAGEVVARIRALVESGHKEAVLTGVDITSYGRDLPGQPTLGRLVRQVLRHVPELKRLRLSSIDQVEVDRYLLDCLAAEERLMPHLHLSMQSGDSMILKRMKRRHSREDAIAFCKTVRGLRPDIVFGADLIAGFPTEDEEMFANTLSMAEACGLSFLHVFSYSRRSGTPAARMPQVAGPVIKERASRLREKGRSVHAALLDRVCRTPTEVLVERNGTGRTPQFVEAVIGPAVDAGRIVAFHPRLHDGRRLHGEITA